MSSPSTTCRRNRVPSWLARRARHNRSSERVGAARFAAAYSASIAARLGEVNVSLGLLLIGMPPQAQEPCRAPTV